MSARAKGATGASRLTNQQAQVGIAAFAATDIHGFQQRNDRPAVVAAAWFEDRVAAPTMCDSSPQLDLWTFVTEPLASPPL